MDENNINSGEQPEDPNALLITEPGAEGGLDPMDGLTDPTAVPQDGQLEASQEAMPEAEAIPEAAAALDAAPAEPVAEPSPAAAAPEFQVVFDLSVNHPEAQNWASAWLNELGQSFEIQPGTKILSALPAMIALQLAEKFFQQGVTVSLSSPVAEGATVAASGFTLSTLGDIAGYTLQQNLGIIQSQAAVARRFFLNEESQEALDREIQQWGGGKKKEKGLPPNATSRFFQQIFQDLEKQCLEAGGNAALGLQLSYFVEIDTLDPQKQQLRVIATATAAVLEKNPDLG